MGSFNGNYDEADIALSAFALALALPVRIFIIRKIIEQGNSATKDDFKNTAFNAETVDKHLQQLKKLHVLKLITLNKKAHYSIDADLFKSMSANFSVFINGFESVTPANQVTAASNEIDGGQQVQNFGSYLKTQRKSFQLTQGEFSLKLSIDRPLLSKIESSKAVFPEDKLLMLSQVIHEKMADIKKIYYSDFLEKLLLEGCIDDEVFELAKLKTRQ